MTKQKLYSLLRQAIDEFNMIEDGDKIAVGVSGGKDSMTLLYGLAGLQSFYPKKFEIVAILVDLGYNNISTPLGNDESGAKADNNESAWSGHQAIKRQCDELDVKLVVVQTKINEMMKDGECSLCARLRKGALTDKAIELGCNKIAYAHNEDDVVETMMMNLIYEGRFTSFWPVTKFEDNNISVIRPLMYVSVANVVGFVNKNEVEIEKSSCPFDKTTKRTYVRELIREIDKEAPGVRKRMMTALKNDGKFEGE